MAASKKYAHLPDLDAAPEVYETPDLTDDVSTAQTATVRTLSSPSSDDEEQPGLDRQSIDRAGARRRFEPALVDTRGVDFSDSIAGPRRSYRTRSARRLRRRVSENGGWLIRDLSDSEDETVEHRLARLKREAEELRLILEKRDQGHDAEVDGKGNLHGNKHQARDEGALGGDTFEELSRALDSLSTISGPKTSNTVEAGFLSSLDAAAHPGSHQDPSAANVGPREGEPLSDTLSAAAAISDRLTSLETALGATSFGDFSPNMSILPKLDTLSTRVNILFDVLAPKPPSPDSSSATTSSLLDTVAAKLQMLTAESERLTVSRKQAIQSLADLHEIRMRHLVSATVHTNTRPRRGLSNTSSTKDALADLAGPGDESLQLQSRLFLDEQAHKITALHQLLPSIQDMQPLLPIVLERLRSLSVIHAGAADAKNTLDSVERRQAEMNEDITKWRDALEDMERGMQDLEEAMKGNVKTVGDMVSGLESRFAKLERDR